ncbi:MAG TPA: VTT domain-containing protein [Dehalococcoidia bacterium]|nr:VTT domain-containing protein [Dehalococcoidia bacterium]
MSVLSGLHGTIASIILYALLFADETGLPIPFAPNEVLLLLAGVLIRTGAISAWIFLPAALVVMAAGMLVGYGWAHAVGRPGVARVVRLVHAEAAHRRILGHLEAAGPLGIGVARLLPGVRPWATLSCGAMGIRLPRFLLAALPALLLWLVSWTALGVLVGLPVEHLLGVFQKLLLRGVLLVVIGAAGYVGLRRLQRQDLVAERRRVVWLPLTLLLTGAAVASMAAGVLAIGRGLVGDDQATWVDALLVAVVVTAVGGATLVKNQRRHLNQLGPQA